MCGILLVLFGLLLLAFMIARWSAVWSTLGNLARSVDLDDLRWVVAVTAWFAALGAAYVAVSVRDEMRREIARVDREAVQAGERIAGAHVKAGELRVDFDEAARRYLTIRLTVDADGNVSASRPGDRFDVPPAPCLRSSECVVPCGGESR